MVDFIGASYRNSWVFAMESNEKEASNNSK
jgi:hypothetical protein